MIILQPDGLGEPGMAASSLVLEGVGLEAVGFLPVLKVRGSRSALEDAGLAVLFSRTLTAIPMTAGGCFLAEVAALGARSEPDEEELDADWEEEEEDGDFDCFFLLPVGTSLEERFLSSSSERLDDDGFEGNGYNGFHHER